MAYRRAEKLLFGPMYPRVKPNRVMNSSGCFYHGLKEPHDENLPSKWYEKAFPMLTRLTHLLKGLDFIDGRLVNVYDYSIVADEYLIRNMHTFKSLARAFIGYSSVQLALQKDVRSSLTDDKCTPPALFSKPSERQPLTVNSLTKVCNFLNVSAQQRKEVRLSICPQVTQHHIWTGALEETLNALKSDVDFMNNRGLGKIDNMAQQIIITCLKFLDTAISCDPDSTSWMRPSPMKFTSLPSSHKWEDVLEMFNDLINCLRNEKDLVLHVTKLEVMKEGLSQIKDVLIDKNIGHRETRYQESLVSKKLSKTLGHSSRCLFTLLLYYLYGSVRDIEVELCGGVYRNDGEKKFCLCMGKILTSDEEKMVRSGVKQLDRALGLFKLVWETVEMKGSLEVQGHLWCAGAESRSFTYKGNVFFAHGISL